MDDLSHFDGFSINEATDVDIMPLIQGIDLQSQATFCDNLPLVNDARQNLDLYQHITAPFTEQEAVRHISDDIVDNHLTRLDDLFQMNGSALHEVSNADRMMNSMLISHHSSLLAPIILCCPSLQTFRIHRSITWRATIFSRKSVMISHLLMTASSFLPHRAMKSVITISFSGSSC